MDLSNSLQALATRVLGKVDDGILKITVRRGSILNDALQNIARSQGRLLKPISVRFIGEPAVDDGGPSRELASELMKELSMSKFVQGIKCYESMLLKYAGHQVFVEQIVVIPSETVSKDIGDSNQ